MKKTLLLLLFFLATHGQADSSNFYAKILSGPNFLQTTNTDGNQVKYHTGYIVSGSLGFCWYNGLGVEAEYAFRRNGIRQIDFFVGDSSTTGRLQTSSYMANLLWEIHPLKFWKIEPFIGSGAGYDFEQMKSSNSRIVFNQKWHHFSWQLMAGFALQTCRNLDLTLEYKFHQGGSQFNNHTLGVGLIYKFGFLKKAPAAKIREP
jgi:opacity protein-like surface antigen